MPPFREGPIIVDRRLNGDALKELRDIGHGHRVNIVDASYDIPRRNRIIDFPGTSAETLLGIVRLIPVEDDVVTVMRPDPELEPGNSVTSAASHAFFDVIEGPLLDQPVPIKLHTMQSIYRKDEDQNDPAGIMDKGFYTVANQGDEQRLYICTIDELPFACATLVAGHSQKNE